MSRSTRTHFAVGVAFVATVIVPAAQADSWARDRYVALDPAIAAALKDRATQAPESVPLDIAIATAIEARTVASSVSLDPAIRAALMERASSTTRPDDRAAARGVGALPQPVQGQSTGGFDWSGVSLGLGAAFAALLLAVGSLLTLKQRRSTVTSA